MTKRRKTRKAKNFNPEKKELNYLAQKAVKLPYYNGRPAADTPKTDMRSHLLSELDE